MPLLEHMIALTLNQRSKARFESLCAHHKTRTSVFSKIPGAPSPAFALGHMWSHVVPKTCS
jgi:hypothetical protein